MARGQEKFGERSTDYFRYRYSVWLRPSPSSAMFSTFSGVQFRKSKSLATMRAPFFSCLSSSGCTLLFDRVRQQVDGHQIGGTVVLLQQVAVDDVGVLLQPELEDPRRALLAQVLVQFHADRFGMKFLRGHDDDAAVAADPGRTSSRRP